MKKQLLCFAFIILSILGLNGQTWKHKVENSDFDGRYDWVYAIGYGGSFPYQNPQFIVRNKTEDELYITGLGYTGCDNNSLIIVFDSSRRYKAYGSPSTDNKALFIESLFSEVNGDKLTIYHLLQEIMKSSKMSVRFENDCGIRDFYFKLDGSTSALTKMFGSKIKNEISAYEAVKVQQALEIEERAKLKAFNDSLEKAKSDSIKEWRTQVIHEKSSMSDSIITHFLINPTIDGEKVSLLIQDKSREKASSVMASYINSMKPDEVLIGFDLSQMKQSKYKLIMVCKDGYGDIQKKWLYQISFRLTELGELIVL